ncbi:MAG: alpha/beta fold hydrolase [Oscillospiraceae bacterium]|nr:alpha/beta fold hydrolase [Oscillospiraceae bacterium]
MKIKFLELKDGCKIYAELYMNNFDKTLLFLHGGPGAGCDYFRYHAELLSESMNVVIFDQRGVLRSDAIDEENFNAMVLVEDIEDIRQILNIDKICLAGHSFGGFLALVYALKYPQNTDKIVFMGATFDFGDSNKSFEDKAIEKLFALNDEKLTKALTELVSKRDTDEDFNGNLHELMPPNMVGEIFHPKPQDEEAISKIFYNHTEEDKQKTEVHKSHLWGNPEFDKSRLDELKNLKSPSLLIVGEYDTVCSKNQREAYKKSVSNGELKEIDGCGHTLHMEIPKIFVNIVADFINK